MKFITKSTDTGYLRSLRDLLEANGIPAVVNGENTARMVTPFIMTEASLWIYVDEQFDEAKRLIADPDYEVQHPVDMAAFREAVRPELLRHRLRNNALVYLGGYMVMILVGMAILVKIMAWLAG